MHNRIAVALVCVLSLCSVKYSGAQPRPTTPPATAATETIEAANARVTAEIIQDANRLLNSGPADVTVTQTANLQFDDYWRRVNAELFRRPQFARRGPLSLRRMLNPVRFKLIDQDRAPQLQTVENILCLNNSDPRARPFAIACYFAGNPVAWTRSSFPCQNNSFNMASLWPRHCHHREILTDGRYPVKLREEQHPTTDQVFRAGTVLVSSPHVTTFSRVALVRRQIDRHVAFAPPVTPEVLASYQQAEDNRVQSITSHYVMQQVPVQPPERVRFVYRESRSAIQLCKLLGGTNVLTLVIGLVMFLILYREIKSKQRSLQLAHTSNDGLRKTNTDVATHARNADRALVSQREIYEQRVNERASAVARVRDELSPFQLDTVALEKDNRDLRAENKGLGEKLARQVALAAEQQQIAEDQQAQVASRDRELAELRPLAESSSTCLQIIANRLPELADRTLSEVVISLLTENDVMRTDLVQTKELLKDRNDRINRSNSIITRLFELLRSISRRDEPYGSLQDAVEKLCDVFVGMPTYRNTTLLATQTLRPRAATQSFLPPRIELTPLQRPQISLPTGEKRENTGSFNLNEQLPVEQLRDSWVEELKVKPSAPGYRPLKDSTPGSNMEPGGNRPRADEPTPSGVRCFPEQYPRIEEVAGDDDETKNKGDR